MAQLIKLQDYISRYEQDFYHYPGQFLRMKKESWQTLLYQWEEQQEIVQMDDIQLEDKKEGRNRFLNFFKKKKEEDVFFFDEPGDLHRLPNDKEDLKGYFLDYLLPFQIKWASSTVFESSFVENKFYQDPLLKYFLHRFPDTFLVMYNPIFQLKNAIVDGDIILITPVEILCIFVMEEKEDVTIVVDDGRTWHIEENDIKTKTISPLINLKRTESIVKSILKKHDISSLPIYKIVLSRTNKINFQSEPFHTRFIDQEHYKNWFEGLRNLSSPLKHDQLKAGEALLRHCLTTAVKRPEWDKGENEDNF